MKKIGARVSTVGVIAAAAALLANVGAGSATEFHCTASSQAPGTSAKRAPRRLVPGRPVELALCRYGAAPAYALDGSRLVTRRKRVHRLVHGLNALPTMPSGPVSCPADDGSSIVVYALYRRAATKIVHVGLTGCLIARRRDVVRWDAPSGGRFVHELEKLTR